LVKIAKPFALGFLVGKGTWAYHEKGKKEKKYPYYRFICKKNSTLAKYADKVFHYLYKTHKIVTNRYEIRGCIHYYVNERSSYDKFLKFAKGVKK
jgi:hypothetical protein